LGIVWTLGVFDKGFEAGPNAAGLRLIGLLSEKSQDVAADEVFTASRTGTEVGRSAFRPRIGPCS
jgi:hypothetical protein